MARITDCFDHVPMLLHLNYPNSSWHVTFVNPRLQ